MRHALTEAPKRPRPMPVAKYAHLITRSLVARDRELASVDDIVRAEVVRIGFIPGCDRDDLRQSALVAAARALSLFDPERGNSGRAFVRECVRNALINEKRKAMKGANVPRNRWGQRMYVGSLDSPLRTNDEGEPTTLFDLLAEQRPAPDHEASNRELVKALRSRLSDQEMGQLIDAFERGARLGRDRARGSNVRASALERVREQARDALMRLLGRRMLHSAVHRVDHASEDEEMTTKPTKVKVNLPVVKPEELPECHVTLPTGAGYDPADPTCTTNCPDKFTCLRDLVNSRERNAKGLTLDADTEVKAVLAGEMTYDDAVARMKKRNAITESGGDVPDDLLSTSPIGAKPEEPADDDDEESDEATPEKSGETTTAAAATDDASSEEDEEKGDETAEAASSQNDEKEDAEMKKTTKKGRSAKKGSTKKASGAKKGRTRISKEKRVAIYSEGHHRFLPQPRELSDEQMTAALGRVALGQSFDLAIGMEIVRKRRDGGEVVVKIAKNGFVMDGITYPSLSAAGQWASKRAVSGNDFFNVSDYSCTEIRGKGVPEGVFSKQGKGKPAIVGAHGNGEAKTTKAASPKKAAKKAAAKKAPPPPPPAKKKVATKKKASRKAA